MLKSKLAFVAAVAALSFGAIGSAQALTITAGDFKFTIDNYDSGTTGYGTGAVACMNSVAACDAAAPNKAPGSVGSVNTSADTMGIFSIGQISKISDGTLVFQKGGADGYLTGIFGGLQDHTVSTSCGFGGCTTTAFTTGGTWALYQNTSDYDPTHGPSVAVGKDLNALLYPGISGGTLWLSGVFGTGVSSVDPTATYVSSYNSSTIAGQGQAFLDITGGSMKDKFNTDKEIDPNGGTHDLLMDITYRPQAQATANGWTVVSAGQITGNAVPEPGTMALAGLALLGAGLASRRRKS